LGLLLAVAIAGGAAAANAATFSFSFQNTANGGGTVEGVVRGLAASGESSASSVEITANPLGFGLGEYIGSPMVNDFIVADGIVLLFNVTSVGSLNQPPAVGCCSLTLEGGYSTGDKVYGGDAGLNDNGFEAAGVGFDTGISFAPMEDSPGPAPIPLPASGLMLGAALLALGGMGAWRRAAPRA
jgi:hypothetical protein